MMSREFALGGYQKELWVEQFGVYSICIAEEALRVYVRNFLNCRFGRCVGRENEKQMIIIVLLRESW